MENFVTNQNKTIFGYNANLRKITNRNYAGTNKRSYNTNGK